MFRALVMSRELLPSRAMSNMRRTTGAFSLSTSSLGRFLGPVLHVDLLETEGRPGSDPRIP